MFIETVKKFADNILAEARTEASPLFIDHPDSPGQNHNFQLLEGDESNFALSNLAEQQDLMRMLVGLTLLTDDDKYLNAAKDSVSFMFREFTDPAGLPAWGGHTAIALPMHKVAFEKGKGRVHELKFDYPFYEFMWQVDQQATRKFIEAFWNAHMIDWSSLDFNRHGHYMRPIGPLWNSSFSPVPVFFWGLGLTFVNTGSDLYYAAAMLAQLSDLEIPLIWTKRLAKRYIETRQPSVGISGYQFSQYPLAHCNGPAIRGDRAQYQYAPYIPSGHLVYESTIFKPCPVVQRCQLRISEILGSRGQEFLEWACEELEAWGTMAYRSRDNSFLPMLTDGYSLEGFVIQRDGYFGPKGRVESPRFAGADFLWAYTSAYRIAGGDLFWRMARDIAAGNGIGDIGEEPGKKVALVRDSKITDYRFIYSLLDIYSSCGDSIYLQAAKNIAEGIIKNNFRDGWFLSAEGKSINRPEALAILHLGAALAGKKVDVPFTFR